MEKSSDRAQTQGLSQHSCQSCRPHRQAQGAEGDEQHDGQIRPAGELVGGGRRQDAQGQGQPHEQQIGQHIVGAGEDGADEPRADGEPDQHGDGHAVSAAAVSRASRRVRAVVRGDTTASVRMSTRLRRGPVQFKDGQQAEEDGAGHAPCDSRDWPNTWRAWW